jgi:hypothetical protein
VSIRRYCHDEGTRVSIQLRMGSQLYIALTKIILNIIVAQREKYSVLKVEFLKSTFS